MTASVVLSSSGRSQDNGALAVAAIVIAMTCLAVLWRLGTILGFGLGMTQRVLALSGRTLESRLGPHVSRARQAISTVTNLSLTRRFRLGFWSLFCWGAYFATFHLILVTFGVDLPFLRTVLGSSAAIVGSVVPISGLGTFGALEGGWTAGFVSFGLDPATAACTAILMSGLT